MANFSTPHGKSKSVPTTPRLNSPPASSRALPMEEDGTTLMTLTKVIQDVKELIQEYRPKSNTGLKKDIKVDPRTCNEIHTAVVDMAKEDKTWNYQLEFKEGRNPQHTADLILRVQSKLGEIQHDMVYKGCRTYFHTLKRQEKHILAGKVDINKKKQRKRQRRTNLRYRRLVTLNRAKTIAEEDMARLREALQTTEYISSEDSEEMPQQSDSDDEMESGTRQKILIKRTLQWRSNFLNQQFAELDRKAEKRNKRSSGGGARFMERRIGNPSEREEPDEPLPFAVTEFEET